MGHGEKCIMKSFVAYC